MVVGRGGFDLVKLGIDPGTDPERRYGITISFRKYSRTSAIYGYRESEVD